MKYEDVKTFDDYEAYVREQGPEEAAVLDKCERVVDAVIAAMEALKEMHMGMYTYDLDEMPVEPEVDIEEEEPEAIAAVV